MTTSSDLVLRPMGEDEAEVCETIMRALPDWFGINEAIVQYRRDVENMETIVAERDGTIVGFLTLNHHNAFSSEVQVLAVLSEHHRRGIGKALVLHAESRLADRETEFLQVKTLGPSREDESYAKTRKFYAALGFRPLEENNLWGDVNPCLIQVKHLSCRRNRPESG